MKLYKLHDAWILKRQIVKYILYVVPLRMHKCIMSDISKVMYQMKCMDPLHASPTVNLSDPNLTSKMLVVIQIQTVRHTYGIGWYFKSRLASVLKTN